MISNISKKLLATVLTLFVVVNQLNAMKRLREESTETPEIDKKPRTDTGNNIIMRISSDNDFYKFDDKKNRITTIKTTIEGFENVQIKLKQFSSPPKQPYNVYPIECHSTLKYLNENDKLIILRHDCNKDEYVEVLLDETIKERILQYFSYCFTDDIRNCFNFVNETVFDWVGSHKDDDIFSYDLLSYDEKYLKCGDAITLLKYKKKTGSIESKHYALCLGNDRYISKMGKGSPLYVTTLEALKKIYDCNKIGILAAHPLPMSSFKTISGEICARNNIDSVSLIRLIQQFSEDLNQEINKHIMSLFCSCFDQAGPEGILNLIRHARRVFGFDRQETINIVQSYMNKKNQSLKNILNKNSQTVLHLAVKADDIDSVRIIFLLAGDTFGDLIQALDQDKQAPAHCPSISESMFDRFFKIASIKKPTNEPLQLNFYYNENIKKYMLKLLDQNSIKPMDLLTLQDSGGRTLLHQEYDSNTLSLIVDRAGSEACGLFFIKDNEGLTPLHFAAKSANLKTIDFLLKNAGNRAKDLILLTTNQGMNALDYAKEYVKKNAKACNIEKIQKRRESVVPLLEKYLEQM